MRVVAFFIFVVYMNTAEECRKTADVVFVIDSSSNLLYEDFQMYILGTVTEIIRHLDVDLGTTRVAVVPFANTAKVHFFLQIMLM